MCNVLVKFYKSIFYIVLIRIRSMYVRKFCMYAMQGDCEELAVIVFQCHTVYKYLFHSKRFSIPDTGGRGVGGAYRIGRLRRPSDDVLSLILTFLRQC